MTAASVSPVARAEATRHAWLVVGLCLIVACALVGSLFVGYAGLDVTQAIADALRGAQTLPAIVLVELRLPRALLGCFVGFSLGLAGAAMQGFLRNPLAEPGVVGVSGAAALGAVIAFYSGLSTLVPLALPFGAIAGAIFAALLLFALVGRGASTMTVILAGVAINSFAAALTSLALNLSPNGFSALEIVYWLMGSLVDRSLPQVWLASPFMVGGWVMLLTAAPALDALSLGEPTARSLGFDMGRLRVRLVVGAALAVGASVAVSGAIGFVGLVAPHVLRPFVGHRPGRLLFVSGLGGAALLLLADIAARLLPIRPELKLGVITAMVGAPFLFHLVYRLRREA